MAIRIYSPYSSKTTEGLLTWFDDNVTITKNIADCDFVYLFNPSPLPQVFFKHELDKVIYATSDEMEIIRDFLEEIVIINKAILLKKKIIAFNGSVSLLAYLDGIDIVRTSQRHCGIHSTMDIEGKIYTIPSSHEQLIKLRKSDIDKITLLMYTSSLCTDYKLMTGIIPQTVDPRAMGLDCEIFIIKKFDALCCMAHPLLTGKMEEYTQFVNNCIYEHLYDVNAYFYQSEKKLTTHIL